MGNGQTRLENKLELGFSAVEKKISAVEHKISAVEHKISAVEHKVDLVQLEVQILKEQAGKLEARFDWVEAQSTARFDKVEAQSTARFDKAEAQSTARFDKAEAQSTARFDKMVDKLDANTNTLNQMIGTGAALAVAGTALKIWESLQTTRKAATAVDKVIVGGGQ
ncbi:hypothetical protein V8C86DRAFT_2439017 [Haematococcus lacustris]